MSDRVSDISIHLRQINTPDDTLGRVNLEQVAPGRTDEIRAGISNIGVGQILILDADGNPDAISKEDNDRTDNVGWDVRVIGGIHEREHIATFTIGKPKDGKWEKDTAHGGGHVPFEGIREEVDSKVHANVAHFRYTEGLRGEVFFRQWRVTKDGVRHESDWLGASDGRGFRMGSQV